MKEEIAIIDTRLLTSHQVAKMRRDGFVGQINPEVSLFYRKLERID